MSEQFLPPLEDRRLTTVTCRAALEAAVSTVVNFLQSEIRESTLFLVHMDQLKKEADSKNALGNLARDDSWETALGRRTQTVLGRCERWLVREKEHVPIKDSVFQDVAWLCGVAQDVLPDLIQDAKESVTRFNGDEEHEAGAQRRLEYVEEVYLFIHDYIASLLKGNRPLAASPNDGVR